MEVGESTPDQAGPDGPQVDEPAVHVAGEQDATEATQRADRLAEILARGDARDRAAEGRDRSAEGRDPTDPDGASLDRNWSGRDRDGAAEDRADLVELLRPQEPETPDDAENHP